VAALLLFLAACRTGPKRAAAIGEAYVGPATMNLRRDISLQSPMVAVLKHGDRLEILQQRRVFFRVRTAKGAEGWTHGSQLMSAADMAEMKQLTERAKKMPPQGEAMVYDALNVHTLPTSRSPSFMQLKAKEKFTVVTHLVMPRVDLPHAPLVPPTPKKAPAPKKETKASGRIPPPPLPKPPALPQDWQEISKPTMEDLAAEGVEEAQPAAPPVGEDDWSLIRTASGQTGWVLTRKITMAIPDEVAQYAEGRRIVSYFPLGEIQDGDAKKNIWLWTTIGEGHPPCDFQSFRVFIWNPRRHRYETAYIERNVQGYAPVELEQVSYGGGGKTNAAPVKYPGFSLCVKNKDGQLVRREYALLTNIVRFAGERACELPPPVFNVQALLAKSKQPQQSPVPVAAPEQPKEDRGLMQKLKSKLKGLIHKG